MTLAVGREIDAWCTSCRLDLGHRIVALVDGAPKRVVCLTCNKTHNYRRPASAKAAERTTKAARSASKTPRTSGARSASARAAAVEEQWSTLMGGAEVGELVPYSIRELFDQGQHLQHTKFGPGVVQEVLGSGKISVLFRDGARTLVHGRS